MCDISGWIREHLSDSEEADENAESPSFDDREKISIPKENLNIRANQIRTAKRLFRVSTMAHRNDS